MDRKSNGTTLRPMQSEYESMWLSNGGSVDSWPGSIQKNPPGILSKIAGGLDIFSLLSLGYSEGRFILYALYASKNTACTSSTDGCLGFSGIPVSFIAFSDNGTTSLGLKSVSESLGMLISFASSSM